MKRNFGRYLLQRLREPSTWSGIGVLGILFGIRELQKLTVPEIAAGIAAVASILIPEKK